MPGAGQSTDALLLPPKPVTEAKTVYEAAPEIRDLRKEAVSAFVPTAVRMKMQKARKRTRKKMAERQAK